MKTLKKGIVWAVALNVFLLILGLVSVGAWLVAADRMSMSRLKKVQALFMTTTDQDMDDAVEPMEADGQDDAEAADDAKASGGEGRRVQELRSLKQYIENQTRVVEMERKKLDAERMMLDAGKKALVQQVDDKGLAKAIELYEGLPPKQVKNIFLEMMKESEPVGLDRVAKFLTAMDGRKAAAILEQFKDPVAEVPMATKLMKQLRGAPPGEPTG
jgi:hypothetical protein